MNRKDVAIAVIARGGRVLICRRKRDDSFGGYWEFPGGKREPDETPEQCLKRELLEELDLEVDPTEAFPPIEHAYATVRVRLLPYLCSCPDDAQPRPLACERMEWVEPTALREFKFPSANGPLIEQVIARLGG